MKKTIVKIICFLTILLCILGYTNKVLSLKDNDGIYGLTKFYEQKENSIDVLVLGSSHAFEDVNTSVLWNEYGMAAYDLCGSIQPMWNTYYYLKEALKTQTPDVVVLEAFTTTFMDEYGDDIRIIKNTQGMKWSKDKIEAIKVSAPKERQMDFLLEYVQYHSRYSELAKGDFAPNLGQNLFKDWKGFGCNTMTSSFEKPDVGMVEGRGEMLDKTEEYYRKTIELAQSNNIPICVVVSPYPGITDSHQAIFNTAADIAAEYGVPFINYNLKYDEIGLDFAMDYADENHLNHRGTPKYTKVLGEFLKENFVIDDNRGKEEYLSWEKDASFWEDYIANQYLRETIDIPTLAEMLQDKQYTVIVTVDGRCNTEDLFIKHFFEMLNIPVNNENGIWVIQQEECIAEIVGQQQEVEYFAFDSHDIEISRKYDENTLSIINKVVLDNVEYKKVENGINVVVYSNSVGEVVDSFAIDADNDYICVR